MGEVEYPSSLTYLVEELCISSVTLQRKLMEDNSYQISTLVIVLLRVDCPLHFPIEPIESGSDVNLLGSDN
ncbi:hypothetical protein GW17_00027370 [Ensete ventricosum]|uniref:Uncharacterized protein n=1 Tax=Ensete ventricosum TaxID=4639 RepID=A0A444EFI7_ENSVE|nr:hypothetical protein GW17_00027370 [Ensete ventricosum]RZR73547.1 hypothetical protein BHM03_00025502 [Ensete ventricosum]